MRNLLGQWFSTLSCISNPQKAGFLTRQVWDGAFCALLSILEYCCILTSSSDAAGAGTPLGEAPFYARKQPNSTKPLLERKPLETITPDPGSARSTQACTTTAEGSLGATQKHSRRVPSPHCRRGQCGGGGECPELSLRGTPDVSSSPTESCGDGNAPPWEN